MSNLLLISEDFVLTDQISSSFENVGWASQNVTMISMMGQGSELMHDKSCSILVVDAGFYRYGGLVVQMSAVIRNCSLHAPFYLIFKGEYDRIFDVWAKHAKRTFQSAIQPFKATQAISEIIRLETSSVAREAYYSPMDSI
jgi:hypothetical protein